MFSFEIFDASSEVDKSAIFKRNSDLQREYIANKRTYLLCGNKRVRGDHKPTSPSCFLRVIIRIQNELFEAFFQSL